MGLKLSSSGPNLDASAQVLSGVTAPAVPPEARQFLQYLPTIAEYIRKNRRPSRGELSLLRTFVPQAFGALRTLTYEQIVEFAAPYEVDPQFTEYVRLVKSDQGRAWIVAVLEDVRKM